MIAEHAKLTSDFATYKDKSRRYLSYIKQSMEVNAKNNENLIVSTSRSNAESLINNTLTANSLPVAPLPPLAVDPDLPYPPLDDDLVDFIRTENDNTNDQGEADDHAKEASEDKSAEEKDAMEEENVNNEE